jgi:hypothetical protein
LRAASNRQLAFKQKSESSLTRFRGTFLSAVKFKNKNRFLMLTKTSKIAETWKEYSCLMPQVESYKKLNGHFPEVAQTDEMHTNH